MQNYQSQIRLMIKMQFQIGVARRICETIGTLNMPSVSEKLGQMAAKLPWLKVWFMGWNQVAEIIMDIMCLIET